jgi:hypothetical protein
MSVSRDDTVQAHDVRSDCCARLATLCPSGQGLASRLGTDLAPGALNSDESPPALSNPNMSHNIGKMLPRLRTTRPSKERTSRHI